MPPVRPDTDPGRDHHNVPHHSDDEYYGRAPHDGRAPVAEVLKEQLTKTPWWMVSVGLHAVLFMIGYFVMSEVVATPPPIEFVAALPEPVDEFDPEVEIDQEVEHPSEIKSPEPEIPMPDISEDLDDPSRDQNNTGEPEGDPENSSDQDFQNDNRFATIGPGGGGGSPWGLHGPGSNKFTSRTGGGDGPGTQVTPPVKKGLEWLARHQGTNGAWHCTDFAQRCTKNVCDGAGGNAEYTPGTTSLAVLAFLGAGHTHRNGRYKHVVRKGVEYLRSIQTPDGCVGAKGMEGHYLYNHAIATMALAEAYGMTSSESLKRPAQQAVDFLVQAQNPYLGWRYGIRPGDSDTSITGWAVLALKSAKIAELNVAPEAFVGAMNWVSQVTDDSFFKTGYTQKGDNGARLPEAQRYQPTEAMTAAGLCVRIFTGATRDDPAVRGAAALLRNQPPQWNPESGNDFYYWYYGTLAMYQLGKSDWATWEKGMKQALVTTQRRGGDEQGSWDPSSAWGSAGGRVYATAINVLSLEIYFRYSKVLGGGR